ncbi:RBP11-like subunits of RNA polymerase [Coprinopsis marcescibilis]|uniref:RBP11-like subunits of RNA polymerase n=1 Tax=Coprinopsis marcescibilis TaxID=230819 RepID=A0A5C3KZQ0_COPMA|nr:RBP11-like subunits of RNA polymerase [Coprinopsis marcescibilis]
MSQTTPKIKILPGATPDLSAATFQIFDESHTAGNALRWILMKNNPHPSENMINIRIQMYDGVSSLEALINALDNLDKLCETVEDRYLDSLREENFERWDEKR